MKKIIIVIAFLMSGCGLLSALDGSKALKKEMNGHLNKTSTSLILSYGQPYSKTSDGSNGFIWMYPKSIYEPAQTLYTSGGSVTTPSRVYWLYKLYFVNAVGIVYHWSYNTQEVPPQRIDMRVYQDIHVTTH